MFSVTCPVCPPALLPAIHHFPTCLCVITFHVLLCC
jgi:hypothetical protein